MLYFNTQSKKCMMLIVKHLLAQRDCSFTGYAELIAATAGPCQPAGTYLPS